MKHTPLRVTGSRQAGAAAIIVTLITMVIVSLIVLGFATISRREQRLTLDQQLSAQAFYAAESAVEDAKKVIQDTLAASQPLVGKQRCDTNDAGGNYPVAGGTVIDDANSVSYTCLKVDVTPSSLVYDDVSEKNVVIPIKTDQPITRLDISWQPSAMPSDDPSSCPNGLTRVFSPQPAWDCGYSVLKADLLPAEGALTRAGLGTDTLSAFYVPARGVPGGNISYADRKGQANVTASQCDFNAYADCRISIDNLPPTQEYSLRLNAIYRSSRVIITAYDNNNLPLDFQEGQAVVDATGKAQDVLRRIQVRLPIKPGAQGPLPTFAVQSNAGVCKHFRLNNTYFNIPGDIVDPDTGNPMCVAKSDGVPPAPCTTNSEIMLTMDISGSLSRDWQTRRALNKAKESINSFIQDATIANGNNRAAVVAFADNATLASPLTFDRNQLTTAVNNQSAAGGAYYLKAFDRIEQELSTNARSGSPRTIVVVTDGVADDSTAQIRARANALKDAGVRIYVVAIDGRTYNPAAQGPDTDLMEEMANAGRYTLVGSEAQLDTTMQTIANELSCR